MSGFGDMPFGTGPYGLQYAAPSDEQLHTFVSSRRLDGNGKIMQDSTGDFQGMNDTLQRAFNLLSRDLKSPGYIVADFVSTQEAAVKTILSDLTNKERSLEIVSVTAFDNGGSTTGIVVELRDLVTGRVDKYIK